jgi:inner membrane protein involved in colicin E2 resistance
MGNRIVAIVFIFFCTAVAWMILGATISSRTYEADTRLENKVASGWGTRQTQTPPNATYWVTRTKTQESTENGQKVTRQVEQSIPVVLPLESSRINVALNLDYRQKGLLWYSTYAVDFSGEYGFRNTSSQEENVNFQLKLPASKAIYDDLAALVNGKPAAITTNNNGASASAAVPAGSAVLVAFTYRSQGMESWAYRFGDDVAQVRNFSLDLKTNFKDVDFPQDTLSPTEKHAIPGGWVLGWKYKNLLSGVQIGTTMPEKLQPGPLAGQISYFAPVSLFFFFFVIFIITTLRGNDLHPTNYFFLATAFFAFHLLLAYLVDHISIHLAFIVCSAVSVFLVVSYLRLVVGLRFAALEAGLAQLIYLVLFSYAFFFKGFTGLAVTIGAILTLFVVMQMTGRVRWSEKFASKPVGAVSPL